MKKLFILILLLLTLVACTAAPAITGVEPTSSLVQTTETPAPEQTPSPDVPAVTPTAEEDNTVYRVALSRIARREGTYLLASTSNPFGSDVAEENEQDNFDREWNNVSGQLPAIGPDLFRSFWERNKEDHSFSEQDDLRVPVTLIYTKNREEIREILPEEGYLLVSLSRPGYSEDGRHALVGLSYGCGAECGRGVLLLLERADNGSWSVIGEVEMWIS